MNDPGLDEPIGEADKEVHDVQDGSNPQEKAEMNEEQEEDNFLMPARWWYASTGIPLVAGTFGPMANAFSICALVENWRVQIPPGGTEEHGIDIKDPKWLIAVNAVSLACALVANLALLLNMARRIPFYIAQPVTIIGFWVASVLLIGLLATASTDSVFHAPGVKHQALSQAYYYGLFAAGLYQLISYLMCITVWGAYAGHYSKEFKLTVAQRTLMLQTISFLVYQNLWALGYSHIEGWKFLDAIYWADFTSLTIGIGADYVPKTHLGRSLLFPFAIGGIIILGLVIGSIRSLVLDRGKKKLAARMTEKTRRRLIKRVAKAMEDDKKRKGHIIGMKKDMAAALALKPGEGDIEERDRRQYEFEAMRKIQYTAARERRYFSLLTSLAAWAFLWFMGAFIFYKTEKNQDWTYFESVYFSYTSLLTIGYGDFQVISNSGKPFFVFWSLLAIPSLTILISNMGDTVVKGVKDVTIWLGEVTLLPSDSASVFERLKYGFYKTSLGILQPEAQEGKARQDEESSDSYQELHPGLAKVLGRRGRRKLNKKDKQHQDRLAKDFEQEEEIEEKDAAEEGDKVSQDAHHYRREIIQQIRRVYADSTASEPKTYSYEEWAYFLKLLGEDESDEQYHRRAQKHQNVGKKECKDKHTTYAAEAARKFADANKHNTQRLHLSDGGGPDETEVVKWSWIGAGSPLMGDKDEPEWVLQKLFERLEDSMRQHMEEDRRNKDEAINDRHASSGSNQPAPEQYHEAREQPPNDQQHT